MVELRLRRLFTDLIGADLALHCETIDVRGSTLTVVTSNPALAHQLRLDSAMLMERLNEQSPGRRLRTIRVRTGRAPSSGGR